MLIAFSDKSNGLSFVRNKNGHHAMRRASMAYTKTCDIAKQSRPAHQGIERQVLAMVRLVFEPKESNSSRTQVDLYSEKRQFEHMGELQNTTEWAERVDRVMSSRKQLV
jgi:hypothetical protein